MQRTIWKLAPFAVAALLALAACGPKQEPAAAASSQSPSSQPASDDASVPASTDDLGPAEAVVRALYAPSLAPVPANPDADPHFTADLARALKAASQPGAAGAIDFDYRYGAQTVQITNLAFGPVMPSPDSGGATEAVTFDNAGKPYQVDYDLLPTASGWRIADVSAQAQNGDPAWSLRADLKLSGIR